MRVDPGHPQGQTWTAQGARFEWLGGRPALDLCNTRVGGRELLSGPADLARWLLEARLVDRCLAVTSDDLDDAVGLRDGLRDCLVVADVSCLVGLADGWLDGAPGRLRVEGETLEARFRPVAHTPRCALVAVVLDALELARERPGQVRECAGERCSLVYLDTSRNHSRRWCSMERCGARAKSTAYYQRHRS